MIKKIFLIFIAIAGILVSAVVVSWSIDFFTEDGLPNWIRFPLVKNIVYESGMETAGFDGVQTAIVLIPKRSIHGFIKRNSLRSANECKTDHNYTWHGRFLRLDKGNHCFTTDTLWFPNDSLKYSHLSNLYGTSGREGCFIWAVIVDTSTGKIWSESHFADKSGDCPP